MGFILHDDRGTGGADALSRRDDDLLRVHLRPYPLVVAQGAPEISCRHVGTPVFAGMIVASAIGLFINPML